MPPGAVHGAEAGIVPQDVGGYRLLRKLGGGGMGTVYEAEDTANGRRVALKLIAADIAVAADAVERFRQEGRLASALTHPRCVFVYAADEAAGQPYIAMELMPGPSLQEVADREGPLPVERALAYILDVIEGLQEAHELGVIHRDVKPSNCFLDAESRVKIGDFGLSKSLLGSAHLTRTGSFVGTPLYASPEQVKGERLDPRSDVYSVAATLYSLLTGRAPFQSGDAAVTLARIVSDPAPSMRTLRPELPPALDKVVLRGLERDRERRWQDLPALRAALLPFVSGQVSLGSLALRLGAFFVDMAILAPFTSLGSIALFAGFTDTLKTSWYLLSCAVLLLYFFLLDGLWGCTVGKRMMGLRVSSTDDSDPPGLKKAFYRTAVWYSLTSLTGSIINLVHRDNLLAKASWQWLAVLASLAGTLLLVWTMRRRNGYRGVHEFLSGTRVIPIPEAETHRAHQGRQHDARLFRPAIMPERIGNYEIQAAARWDSAGGVLLGRDAALGRPVVLWLRPREAASVPAARRQVSRATRPRWLACGQHLEWQWDAFVGSPGSLLTDLVADEGPLPWPETHKLLEGLTAELAAALADGTIPERLSIAQVWVLPNGRPLLQDLPWDDPPSEPAAGETAERRALVLLGHTTVLALEGRPRPAQTTARVRVRLPLHAARLLQHLLSKDRPYQRLQLWQEELRATASRPTQVTRPRRLAHLAVLSAFLVPALGMWILPLSGMSIANLSGYLIDSQRIEEGEEAVQKLNQGASRELAAALLRPKSLGHLQALAQWDADMRLLARVQPHLERLKAKRAARAEHISGMGKMSLVIAEQNMRAMRERQVQPVVKQQIVKDGKVVGGTITIQYSGWNPWANNANFRWRSNSWEERESHFKDYSLRGFFFLAVTLVLWPILWIVWAFLTRGGLTFLMLGIALVRQDGRPALRLQCAWRALLVWLPVTGLLVLSVWVDYHYWSLWAEEHPFAWGLRLASALWWSALGLLAFYVGLAIWLPTRSLHDRLAGTYLVPR